MEGALRVRAKRTLPHHAPGFDPRADDLARRVSVLDPVDQCREQVVPRVADRAAVACLAKMLDTVAAATMQHARDHVEARDLLGPIRADLATHALVIVDAV